MVGIPRSKGCRICVQRRVKCDQTRPTCKNCLKGNRPCPGYDTDLKIHDEGTKLRQRFGQKESVHHEPKNDINSISAGSSEHTQSTESSPEESLELISRTATPDFEFNAQRYNTSLFLPSRNIIIGLVEDDIGFDAPSLQTQVSSHQRLLSGGAVNFDVGFQLPLSGSIYSPYLAQEQLLNTFSSAIAAGSAVRMPKQVQSHTRWLSQLPELFGSKLLDSAVRAVSMVHLGRVHQSEAFEQEAMRFYGKALHLLNESLTNNTRGMATDTLSATILLSFYEMFASNNNLSWVRHAGGAGTLMRIRGPARHRYGLDRDVYLAYRHTIVIEAFTKDEACFLSEPEWLDLSKQVHEDLRESGLEPERIAIFDLAEEFYMENVFIPTTTRDAIKRSEMQKLMTPEEYIAYTDSIRQRALQHRAKLKSISLRFRQTIKRLGMEPTLHKTKDPVFPVAYGFVNVFLASTFVGNWTISMLLNMILKDMEKDIAPERSGLYLMENQEMAREICKITPYMMTSSFLGPFFIIFALRICLMIFGPGEERDWVMKKLTQIGSTHMKMAADIPSFEPDTLLEETAVDPGYFDISWDDLDLSDMSMEDSS
ncbi:hypothetical protein EDD36DRAFT_485477 [Exophiala viscosa]|uniref:Zn(2)-C6 fungal-type domain-containing protein n=1 Tax=Exophiala viscosa TaxID=2486360 RepID=A0AAN6E179_9EURO|nr:hypothetical protein EDD36DRAFT_485477 [Exophiala viscosa]